jgi:Flp pilus assembly protein TadG
MRSDRCRPRSGRRRDGGMVTAELAACLPVLVLILGVAISAVAVVAERVRLQDAAREAARAAGRGDQAIGRRLAEQAAPGARVTISGSATTVVAVASARVHPLGGWVPAITVTERCVAAVEPKAGSP